MEIRDARNRQIDGLRGIIVVLISVFHVFCRYQQIYESTSIPFVELWGDFGVIVFLLISAYFLPRRKERRQEKRKPLTLVIEFLKYICKKLVRLWPSYFVAITVIMMFSFLIPAPSRSCTWIEYLCNIPFVNGFIGVNYVDGAHWYLTYLIAISAVVSFFRCLDIDNRPLAYFVWLIGCGLLYKFAGVGLSRFIGGGTVELPVAVLLFCSFRLPILESCRGTLC